MHPPLQPLDVRADGAVLAAGAAAVDAGAVAASDALPAVLPDVSIPDAPVPDPTRPRTALDTWHALIGAHLAARPAAVSAAGEVYPACTSGDIRRAALRFSRELCLTRYDLANLTATRAAWRDALERVRAIAATLPWGGPYPESERFWLGDARALAQRLAAVDARRNRLVNVDADGLTRAVGVGDPLTTYTDLRAYFLARRLTRTDRGWRYPETTVGDVRQLVRLVEVEIGKALAVAPPGSDGHEVIVGRLGAWHQAAAAVEAGRHLPADRTYPDNLTLWRAYRKVAIPLSVAYDLARADRNPFADRVLL